MAITLDVFAVVVDLILDTHPPALSEGKAKKQQNGVIKSLQAVPSYRTGIPQKTAKVAVLDHSSTWVPDVKACSLLPSKQNVMGITFILEIIPHL